MEILTALSTNWQSLVGLLLGGVGSILAVAALIVSSTVGRNDLINTNSWQTYQTYNSDAVRKGRALTQRLMRETNGRGLPTYAEYRVYFGLDPSALDAETATARQQERQYLHDLAAFYHQTGVLLRNKRLDRDFTLLLVGPGLEDRWAIMEPLADYYRKEGEQDADFPYGGMYLVYQTYRKWKRSDFTKLRSEFRTARRATATHE